MLSQSELQNAIGSTMYSSDGEKVGRVGQVFLDDHSGEPEWATVNTGLFGSNESFVPLKGATVNSDRLEVPYPKETIKDAPNVDVDSGHLDEAEERRLYEHYGREYEVAPSAGTTTDVNADAGTTGTTAGLAETTGTSTGTAPAGHDTSGPDTDDAMTVSEESLRAGTRTQEAGRARLRKYVTVEEETVTVPVRKERAVIEREPITDANVDAATDGPAISEEEHEVVLHEEQPVVEKTVQPKERVRLGTETETTEETITEQVRKEDVEVEGDVDRRA